MKIELMTFPWSRPLTKILALLSFMDCWFTPDRMSFQHSWRWVTSTFLPSGDMSGFTRIGEKRKWRWERILLTSAVEFRDKYLGWGRDLVLVYLPSQRQSWIELLWSDSCSTFEITDEAPSKSLCQQAWREEPCGDPGIPNTTTLNFLSDECLGIEVEDWDLREESTGRDCKGRDCAGGEWSCNVIVKPVGQRGGLERKEKDERYELIWTHKGGQFSH